jgi:hypothetical protein
MSEKPETTPETGDRVRLEREVRRLGSVEVEGKKYKVLDNMGFHHSRGVWAKEVETENGPRIAIRGSRNGAKWEWAKPMFAPAHYVCGQDA